jgi:hypothetical protein
VGVIVGVKVTVGVNGVWVGVGAGGRKSREPENRLVPGRQFFSTRRATVCWRASARACKVSPFSTV